VIHTVSTVEGRLLHRKDFFDLFEALFPGGSITGCPKKRTMEIIDELEDFRRGVYTGSAGYVGFDGNGAMNILIRTMVQKGGRLYYQAGGGIVIDSDATSEYQECLQKAEALSLALKKS
jgi:para-aminobenzoate synthetase component 1